MLHNPDYVNLFLESPLHIVPAHDSEHENWGTYFLTSV